MTIDVVVTSRGPLAVVDGFRGEVLAAFTSAIYLAGSDGGLVVVHDVAHGHTPTSLLVSNARSVLAGVRCGDAVAGRVDRLRIGDLVLDARQARVWSPGTVSSGPVTPTAVSRLRAAAGSAFDRLGSPCDRLVDALDDGGDIAGVLVTLVGCGPGLTPSGDDAIVGLLAVLHRAVAADRARPVIEVLREELPPMLGRTTVISAHYLRLALDGQFGEHLTDLVDSCTSASGPGPVTLANVVATGATSGTDTLVGVGKGLARFGIESDRLDGRWVA